MIVAEKLHKYIFTFVFVSFAIFAAPLTKAQKPELIGEFTDWKASIFDDGKHKTCYILSQPKSKEGKYKIRGEPWFIVRDNNITFIAGYRYNPKCDLSTDPKCQVHIVVDKSEFTFYTQKNEAWVYEDQYKDFLIALKKGRQLTITGISQRGTQTIDTFSLMGFSAAYKKMKQACK